MRVDGESLDLVTARSESYSRPGALPQIAHGAIEEDLARRDFSINAMAVPLHLKAKSGLLDPFNAEEDLRGRPCPHPPRRELCRRRHPHYAGPSAMSRGWASGWRSGTESLLIDNLPMLDTISGDRLLREVQRWLSEERARPTFFCGRTSLALWPQSTRPCPGPGEFVRSAVERSKGRVEAPVWLGILAYALTTPEGEELVARLRLPNAVGHGLSGTP